MVLWFAGAAVAIVWYVFRDPAIDYRLVAAGALLPDAVDVWTGGPWLLHTLVFSIVLLTAVMLGTRGRRRLRRRLLALPIGTFLHLVLDGAWTDTETFWWPLFGTGFPADRLPSLERGLALAVGLELVGVAVAWWFWRRFRLDDAERRSRFLRTGRLDRDLAV